MAARTMAFYFTITYDNGTVHRYWSKPLHMALWERRNKGASFIPADGVPSIDSMFWLAYKAGRDQGLFDEKLLDEWADKVISFEFAEDETADQETGDDADAGGSEDPTRKAD